MSIMPNKGKVGNVILRKIPEGRAPEHYLWKRSLEREWAGEWTLAKLTGYRYKVGLDPSFVEERPEFKRGQLHWYEWILCENGGFISLYDEINRIGQIWTTSSMAERILGAGVGAKLYTTSDERLSHVLRFPLDNIIQICELAGARRARQGRLMTEEQKEAARERLIKIRAAIPPKAAHP